MEQLRCATAQLSHNRSRSRNHPHNLPAPGAVPAFQSVYGGFSLNIGAEYQSVMTGHAISAGSIFTTSASSTPPHTGHIESECRTINKQEMVALGRIDRIVVKKKSISIIDFKTEKKSFMVQKQLPKPYLRQMSIYKKLISSIYPGKRINMFLLWTSEPSLTELDMTLIEK